MMIRAAILTGLFLLVTAFTAVADDTSVQSDSYVIDRSDSEEAYSTDYIGTSRVDSKFSLLDPSRFSMQHSYSVMYSSYGGSGHTIGLYTNQMRYNLSESIDVNVTLGWLHQPTKLLVKGERGVTDYGQILPNVQVKYQPSDKFKLLISYETMPGAFPESRNGYYYWPSSRFWR